MTRWRWMGPAVFALVAALAGCVVAIEPYVTDATFDERLIGTWAEVGDDDTAVVTRDTGNLYAIAYTTGSGPGRFEGRLGRLGDRMVLDVKAAPRRGEVSSAYDDLLIPAHVAVLIDIGADEVNIGLIDPDSLAPLLRDQARLAHLRTKEQVILTGTTAQLRAALASHVGRAGAASANTKFRRVRR